MDHEKKYMIAGIFLLLVVAPFVWLMPFFRFIPLRLDEGRENKLIKAEELETPEFYERLERVLKKYNEKYKTKKNGIVYITLPMVLDKELRWNYTKKSLDDSWLKNVPSGKNE